MIRLPLQAAVVLVVTLAASAGAAPQPAPAPFAVVELFTSEGCSSCPPADRLLSRLAQEAGREHRAILPLEFHVDYWNSPAWTDTFSSAAFSERQRGYAVALRTELYTPQAVVNGRIECVGSNEAGVRDAIRRELARAPRAAIALESAMEDGSWIVRYHASDLPSGAIVCAALTESGLRSVVRGGENAGRELAHDSVVREFVTEPRVGAASGTFRFHPGPSGRPRRAVVFAQDPKTREILAAAGVSL